MAQKCVTSCSCKGRVLLLAELLSYCYAMQLQSLILTLLCFIVQLLAMVWYSLSFIVSPQLLLPHLIFPGIPR